METLDISKKTSFFAKTLLRLDEEHLGSLSKQLKVQMRNGNDRERQRDRETETQRHRETETQRHRERGGENRNKDIDRGTDRKSDFNMV